MTPNPIDVTPREGYVVPKGNPFVGADGYRDFRALCAPMLTATPASPVLRCFRRAGASAGWAGI
mgnify:CR=1 FL=1